MYRKVAAALVAALALGIAGCGGSEPELTKAQLVRRVEAACRAGQVAAARQQRPSGRGRGAVATAFLGSIAAGQEAALERMRDLNAPDAVDADFDAFKQSLQDRLDLIKRAATSGGDQVEAAMRDIQPRVEEITKRLSTEARSIGISGCV